MSLPVDEGMLFIFDARTQTKPVMWMKDTYIPLDILFVNQHLQVACIVEHAKPRSLSLLSCDAPVVAVIELNAGIVKKIRLKKMDLVSGAIFKQY